MDIDDFAAVATRPPPASQDGKRWPGNYRTWIEHNDTRTPSDRAAIAQRIAGMTDTPCISVVMPVHNPPLPHLMAAINSVRCQLYPHWELCIADDGSKDPAVHAVLARFAAADARIRVVYRPVAGHIARASNDALALATGAYVALLDHDDLLPEHALYMVAEEITAFADAAILYSDEDKLDDDNVRYGPYFKQHFNRDNLLGQNCINHLGVFRRTLMLEAGGFLPGTEGAQDYDITLRMLERIEDRQVRHMPHILYHWRAATGSTALDPASKTYAFEAGKRAIAQHLERRHEPATVQHGAQPGVYRIQRPMPSVEVSLIITDFAPQPALGRRDAAWLASLVQPWRDQLAQVVLAADADADAVAFLTRSLCGPGMPRIDAVPKGASWTATANALAARADGDVLVFLAAGLWPTQRHALRELVTQAQRDAVGAAGGRLQRPDGSIMHDGYVMGLGGIYGSFHAGWPADSTGYFGLGQLVRLCAAVSGAALAIRRDLFTAVGGFDEQFHTARADVDLCLRLRQRGHGVVYTPFAAFITPPHIQPQPQNHPDSVRLLHRHRHARVDPYWNPNFALAPGAFELAPDSSAPKPWRHVRQLAG